MEKIKIGVVGTGMIGMSMAANFTGNGYQTVVLAVSQDFIDKGLDNYHYVFESLREKDLVKAGQEEICKKYLTMTLDYADMAECEVILECVFEDLAVKHAVYKEIEKSCPNVRAIFSSSSAIAPSDLCKGADKYKSKIMVAHPFNPPHLVPFVELVKSEYTEEAAAQLVYDVLEDCGHKVCIMKKAAPGFIANRLQHALLREAFYMVEEGMCDPRDIDKALMYSFMPRYTSIGLFEHQDAAGLDLIKSIHDYLFPYLCDRKCSFESVDKCVAENHRGQKDGQGTYTWDEAAKLDFKERAAAPYYKYFNWKLPTE